METHPILMDWKTYYFELLILQKVIYRFNVIPTIMQMTLGFFFFEEIEKPKNYMISQGTLRSQNNHEK